MARRVSVSGKVDGASKLAKNLEMAKERWKAAVAKGLYLEANNVMAASKRQVPVDTGTLRASGYVSLPTTIDNRTMVEMGYGGAAKKYAVYVHEIPTPELGSPHPRQHEPPTKNRTVRHEVGKWKYLEDPVLERLPKMAANIMAIAQAAFAKGAAGIKMAAQGPTSAEQASELAAAVAIAKVFRKVMQPPRKRKGGK